MSYLRQWQSRINAGLRQRTLQIQPESNKEQIYCELCKLRWLNKIRIERRKYIYLSKMTTRYRLETTPLGISTKDG